MEEGAGVEIQWAPPHETASKSPDNCQQKKGEIGAYRDETRKELRTSEKSETCELREKGLLKRVGQRTGRTLGLVSCQREPSARRHPRSGRGCRRTSASS